ncbi:binding partner of ACD11 1, partial [Pyrus x bretschneideri]|uniref:binding partner of ACD11 1 n=1 Tax=Pyrus x bretschneideri TaxID=225117 RepID=UPI00202E6B26
FLPPIPTINFHSPLKLFNSELSVQIPAEPANDGIEAAPQSTAPTPISTNIAPNVKSVKVSNISQAISDKDIKEFLSFSGDIQHVEMQRETENTQLAYVTFKEAQGADTAVLLSGATIADLPVTITTAKDYKLPPEAIPLPSSPEKKPAAASSAVKKAEDVASAMLAKGYILGKDAINKAKAFDERHKLTSNVSATVVSINERMGLMEKLGAGRAVVSEKVREMDQKFMVSEKTKSAFAVAEQKASSAGSSIMSNPYVLTGASWVSNALSAVAKVAEDVGMMAKEKVESTEEEKMEIMHRQRTEVITDFAQTHLDESSAPEPPVAPVSSPDDTKPGVK